MRQILVVGSGRSGTTWIADVLASCKGCYSIFEPLHSNCVAQLPQLMVQSGHLKTYLRPDEEDEPWRAFFHRLFRGEISNHWTRQDWRIAERPARRFIPRRLGCRIAKIQYDLKRLGSDCCITKMIRGNLFLPWLCQRFPLSVLYVTRHPCAVVGSRLRLKWSDSLAGILAQKRLINDYLEPHLPVINAAETPLQRMTVFWCIENLVPLAQLPAHPEWITASYEKCLMEGPDSFNELFEKLQLWPTHKTRAKQTQLVSTPSRNAGKTLPWHYPLTEVEGSEVLELCGRFGIGLYGRQLMPLCGHRNPFLTAQHT